jgi:hypothetical protein
VTMIYEGNIVCSSVDHMKLKFYPFYLSYKIYVVTL